MDSNKTHNKLGSEASELISFVAHQIKSPMVAIKGYADLLANGHYGVLPEEAREIALKVKAASERSLDLAENLLDLKRIEEGKMKYVFEAVNLVEVVQGVCGELQPLADKKKLKLTFHPWEGETKVHADKRTLHQVLQNLVDNAIKYTDRGYVKIEIEHSKEVAVVKVSDSGRGMPDELRKTAFDKFTRDASVHQIIHGVGLGLFIAKNIIEAHKGKIWAESEGEGRGSQFYVSLPITN